MVHAPDRIGSGLASRLTRWWSLDAPERKVAVAAVWRLSVVTWQLRNLGFSRLHRRLETVEEVKPPAGSIATARLAYLVDRAADGVPWTTTCLHRSFALAWMLEERGVTAALRLGVGRETSQDALQFHAWVEIDGTVVNDAADIEQRYRPFPGFAPPPDAVFT